MLEVLYRTYDFKVSIQTGADLEHPIEADEIIKKIKEFLKKEYPVNFVYLEKIENKGGMSGSHKLGMHKHSVGGGIGEN